VKGTKAGGSTISGSACRIPSAVPQSAHGHDIDRNEAAMRPFAVLALLVPAAIGTTPATAANASPATTEIVQQRLSDGRILLTDQPVRGATIERSWQLPVEDPAAARQRAREASAEAERVSERIQRMLDQQRRADEESARTQIARMQMEQQGERTYDDQGFAYGYAPYGWAGQRFHSRFDDHFFHKHFGHGGRPHPAPHKPGGMSMGR
jgi:hypothetical protein